MPDYSKDSSFLDLLSWRKGGPSLRITNGSPAANCLGKAACQGPIKKPLNCAGLAPWVICSFVSCDPIKGSQIAATVGGFDPAAMDEGLIKSFSFGFSDGIGCKLEIHDRKGSDLNRFFQKLNKDIKGGAATFTMNIRWGWVCNPCDSKFTSNQTLNESEEASHCHKFIPTTLQIQYGQGGFKYILEGSDNQQNSFQTFSDKPYGDADKKIPLKEAVVQLYKEHLVSTKVVFKRRRPGSTVMDDIKEPFCNSNKKPWVGVFRPEARHPMAAVADWKHPTVTDAGKGLMPIWDNQATEPTIIYMENGCESNSKVPLCIHTYIVNGGKWSPVISFNPTMNWSPQATAEAYGGGAGSTDTGAALKRKASQEDSDCLVIEATDNVGERTALPPTEAGVENEGPENAQKGSDAGMNAQSNANRYFEKIEAELIVQGDPDMDLPPRWLAQKISIVVCNPFYPAPRRGGGSGQLRVSEWLAEPTCNPILTSKEWTIFEVSHNIKEGSYTTTIKCWMAGNDLLGSLTSLTSA